MIDSLEVELTLRSTRDAYPSLGADELQVAYGAEAEYTCKPGRISLVGGPIGFVVLTT